MKQDPFANVYRALTPKELAEMFMSPNAPKTEAEHWAVREIEKLRAERDTLLLDAHEFVRWFNAHYPDPSTHPDHPWCVINDRLNAHADTLAALDAAIAKTDKEDGR